MSYSFIFCYTVSHFSYAPLFKGPLFSQKCWNRTFSMNIYLLTFYLFDDIEKTYRNHSCESFCYTNFKKNNNVRVIPVFAADLFSSATRSLMTSAICGSANIMKISALEHTIMTFKNILKPAYQILLLIVLLSKEGTSEARENAKIRQSLCSSNTKKSMDVDEDTHFKPLAPLSTYAWPFIGDILVQIR